MTHQENQESTPAGTEPIPRPLSITLGAAALVAHSQGASNMFTKLPAVLGCCLALLFMVGPADVSYGATFHWAGEVVPGDPPPFFPGRALGSPDMSIAAFITDETNATYSSFEDLGEYDPAELAAMLGVALEVVEQADFLAFDSNGNVYPHFEDSSWTFTSGSNTETVQAPDEALATGYVQEDVYMNYFGILDGGNLSLWSFILVDLDQVSIQAEDFAVRVQGAYGPYGRPEIDAMGVLNKEAVALQPATWDRIKSLYR